MSQYLTVKRAATNHLGTMKLSDFPANTQMTRASWSKMIGVWSDLPDSPEKDLLCSFLGQVMEDEGIHGYGPFSDSFFGPNAGFSVYCETLNIKPIFLMEMFYRAAEKEVEFCRLREEREVYLALGRRRC